MDVQITATLPESSAQILAILEALYAVRKIEGYEIDRPSNQELAEKYGPVSVYIAFYEGEGEDRDLNGATGRATTLIGAFDAMCKRLPADLQKLIEVSMIK